ncbi:MAG: radical SAM family heme chaperone HemW [Pseudomonadota bacterium]
MLGIYVHIPFCLKKCDYCDFFSVPCSRDEIPQKEYLQAISRQLQEDVCRLKLSGKKVSTVYFGGGTPSLLKPIFFKSIIDALAHHFVLSDEIEVSCEVNPATVDDRWFGDARECGVTRASIGVQSFHDRLLRELGRVHSSEDAMRAIAEAQDAGFRSINCDLMFGIPSETMADLEEDIRTAMTFQPEHVSAYQLTVEKGTPLAARLKDDLMQSEEDSLNQMRTTARMLTRSGWNRYEISNFAKAGFECRHNLNYWRYGEYLGLGAWATSFVLSTHGFAKRFTQTRDVKKYMEGGAEHAESEEISLRTAMAEFCFLGLRTTEGISLKTFEEIFKTKFDDMFGNIQDELIQNGLAEKNDRGLALTQRGIEVSNLVFEKFLP